MELIGILFSKTLEIFQLDLDIFGIHFSLWQVFLFSIVASLVGWLIGEVFLGD